MRIIALAISLFLMLPNVAAAQQMTLGLSLVNVEHALPQRICVVYRRAADAQAIPNVPAEPLIGNQTKRSLLQTQGIATTEKDQIQLGIRFGIGHGATGNEVVQAFSKESSPESHCGETQHECVTKIIPLPIDSLWIKCATNSDKANASDRLSVLRLETISNTTPTEVYALYLQGSQVSLVLSNTPPDGSLSLTSLGGDYDPIPSAFNHGNLMSLGLTPRCEDRDIDVPGYESKDVSVEIKFEEPQGRPSSGFGCHAPLERPMRIRLPSRSTAGVKKELTVSTVDHRVRDLAEDDGGTFRRFVHTADEDATYSGSFSWRGEALPETLRLKTTRVRFQWTNDPCLYSVSSLNHCPEARLSSGASCEAVSVERHAGGQAACIYTCPSTETSQSMELPIDLQFTVGKQHDAWHDQVAAPDQILSGYADRDSRQFLVDLSQWKDWPKRGDMDQRGPIGDRIDRIEFVDRTGSIQSIAPDENQRVNLQGAACEDVVRYRLVGLRQFDVGYARLEDGRLRLKDPSILARQLSVGGFVSGGIISDTYFKEFRPVGEAQVAVRWEPTFAWRNVDIAWEWDATYMLSSSGYEGLSGFPAVGTTHPGERDVAYSRAFFGGSFDWSVWERIQLGVGFDMGFGRSLKSGLDQFNGLVSPHQYERFRLNQHVDFEVDLRAIGPQPINKFVETQRGNPSRQTEHVWVPMANIGVRLWL